MRGLGSPVGPLVSAEQVTSVRGKARLTLNGGNAWAAQSITPGSPGSGPLLGLHEKAVRLIIGEAQAWFPG